MFRLACVLIGFVLCGGCTTMKPAEAVVHAVAVPVGLALVPVVAAWEVGKQIATPLPGGGVTCACRGRPWPTDEGTASIDIAGAGAADTATTTATISRDTPVQEERRLGAGEVGYVVLAFSDSSPGRRAEERAVPCI